MGKKPTKEVATRETGEVSTEVADLFATRQGEGFEEVTARDIIVPRLAILQDGSPQVKRANDRYVDGAEAGMIADVGMDKLFESPVQFLPCYYTKVYIEWFPRDTKKGIAHIHHSESILDKTTRNEKNVPQLPNGNTIRETAQFFGLVVIEGEDPFMAFIPMAGMQLKKAKRWLTASGAERVTDGKGNKFQPPIYYRSYLLTTTHESNTKGEWEGWVVEQGPKLEEMCQDPAQFKALFDAAVRLREQVVKGEAKGKMDDMDSDVVDVEATTADSDKRAM